jgi:CheY-like chemotaxis protein
VVAVAKNGIEAAERIAALQPDVAFLDIKMPGLTGLDVAQGIEGATRVVFVTGVRRIRGGGVRAAGARLCAEAVKAERLAAPWSG